MAALGLRKVVRRCSRRSVACQDTEPSLLPKVCSQLGKEDVPSLGALPPVGQHLFQEHFEKKVPRCQGQPMDATPQHVPHHRYNGTDGRCRVFPNCWLRSSDRTKPLRVRYVVPAKPSEGQHCRGEPVQAQMLSLPWVTQRWAPSAARPSPLRACDAAACAKTEKKAPRRPRCQGRSLPALSHQHRRREE